MHFQGNVTLLPRCNQVCIEDAGGRGAGGGEGIIPTTIKFHLIGGLMVKYTSLLTSQLSTGEATLSRNALRISAVTSNRLYINAVKNMAASSNLIIFFWLRRLEMY